MSDLAERVRILESWKTGDGARGAEIRLQDIERKTADIEHACLADLSQENAESIRQIETQLSEIQRQQEGFMSRDDVNAMADKLKSDIVLAIRMEKKKGIEKVKAWAPYFASACTLIGGILIVVLKH